MYFEYYNMEFIGICPHSFVYSDLFRVDADDIVTLSGKNVFVIIISTLSEEKRVFLVYLLHTSALFSLFIPVWIALSYSVSSVRLFYVV